MKYSILRILIATANACALLLVSSCKNHRSLHGVDVKNATTNSIYSVNINYGDVVLNFGNQVYPNQLSGLGAVYAKVPKLLTVNWRDNQGRPHTQELAITNIGPRFDGSLIVTITASNAFLTIWQDSDK